MKTLLMLLSLGLFSSLACAHGGEDHGAPDTNVSTNAPQRLPDGRVFLPKDAQRQMLLRTSVAEVKAMPRGLALSGKVVMDPNAGGRVQAMQTGRVSAGPQGLPMLGQRVQRGELLAYVIPAVSGQAGGGRSVAQNRLERMRQLTDIVPRKSLEEAEAAVANEQLRAPVSGVIATANVVLGQVVEARETLFEIVDPQHLLIEALSFDTDIANDIGAAFITLGDTNLPVQFVGSARALREQALPLTFRAQGAALNRLAVGQPVKVVVQTRTQLQGVPLPTKALVKNAANQNIVWVKTGAEHFSPRPVTLEVLDGANVTISSGVQAGERVVIDGASLLNQVR